MNPVPYEKPRGLKSAPVSVPLAVPSWVRGDPSLEKSPKRRAAGARNAGIVRKANADGVRYDFVLYGDSITQNVADRYMDVWNSHFRNGVPLGVGGNTVEELSWRLIKGAERFTRGPKTVGLLVGINNLKWTRSDPAEKLEFLVPWIRQTWPDTKVLLIGLFNKTTDVRPTNDKYKALAERHGATFVSCPVTDLPDGTHPGANGYRQLFGCLKKYVS